MPTFRYRAYDDAGRAVSGELEAEGLKDAVERLRRKGLHPSKVSAAAAAAAGGRAVGADMLALTTRQLATLLGSGSRVTDALSVLADEGGFARLRPVLLDIKDSVAQGNSLARSLETRPDIFSPLYRGLVAAGEASGSLDRALARLADYLETRARITREVKAALAYPALMTVVGTGVLTFLFIFVVPKITRIFEEREAALPWMTVVLMAVTDLVSRYWPYLLIAAAAVAAALRGLFRSGAYRGRLDALLLRVPWFGRLLVHFHTANMARTLGSLLLGGVPLLKALEMTRGAVDNRVFEETLEAAQRRCA
ncbi:MAG TPA: type II secretion system F family protein, partial [Deltaproteobacteria bacterium]|nr:type II secretion system F family protein [Deltaproteobacteria bacterium]